MASIFSFFRKKIDSVPFSVWRNIPYADIAENSNRIDDLYNRKADGYLIKNILSESEIKELIDLFESLDKSKAVSSGKRNFIIPRAFSQIQNENEFDFGLLDSYLTDAQWLLEEMKKNLSFDIQERVVRAISRMQGGIQVTIPEYKTDGVNRPFTFATYRFLSPSEGGMHIHCGSMFREIYPNFYKQLDKMVNFDGQLSYFLMLQRPEKGGKLRLFNAEWKDYKVHRDDRGFIGADGHVQSMEETTTQDIDPMPGDLLMFVGGDIWHEVTRPEQGLPRITLGGFLAYSNTRDQIYIWS